MACIICPPKYIATVVYFSNTVIVMTSNIGADKLTETAAPIGFNLSSSEIKTQIIGVGAYSSKRAEYTFEGLEVAQNHLL